MRRRGALVGTIAILAVALTAGTGATATADPPPLDSVVLTAKQAGPGYARLTMDGGRQVKGQVTLDFCGGGYRSEALRLRRFQTIYASRAGGCAAVERGRALRARGAKQALQEVAAAFGHARGRPCRAPFPARRRAVPRRRPHPRSRPTGGLGGDQDDGRGDRERPQGAAWRSSPSTSATAIPLRRLRLRRHGSLAARERAARRPRERRQPAAQRPADRLIARARRPPR